MQRGLALALALAAGVLAALPALGGPSEHEVKAAYLYNFARYVTWPATAFGSPSDPLRICVLGDDDFEAVLSATVSDKRVGERPVVAERRENASQANGCHILFLKSARAGSVSELSRDNVFTVSDVAGFAKDGGIANFLLSDNKVRFEINPGAVQKAGLQVSSRLLRLAQIVE